MRYIIASLLILLSPKILSAQNPGQNISVDVQIASITVRGDTVGVASIVKSLAASKERLLSYAVDAPSGVLLIRTPTPALSWDANKNIWDRPVAVWTTGALFPAGSSTPQLYFEAIGLPGIEAFWAGGDFQFPSFDDGEQSDSAPPTDPMTTRMISGKTVGVEPWPADRSAKGLLARLRGLTQTSCATPLLWITSSALCTKLIGYLTQAEASRAGGKPTQAKSALNNYITSLSGKTAGTFATGVTSSGYWLLKPNASIVITKL